MIFKKKQITMTIFFLLVLLNITSIHAEKVTPNIHTNDIVEDLVIQTNYHQEILNPIKISYTDFSISSEGNYALILNPSEYLYGNQHCLKIINKLVKRGYNIVYLSNEDVDLSYIKYNLSAEIVYMNTHAGYWDIDGDNVSDTVVISTGEHWTDETPIKYQFDYENQMIVEGRVGDQNFIAFTPALIEYYYSPGDFPNTLIYMATCYAAYDNSMAQVFLEKGASAYVGWNQNTVFWTNSITSVRAFRLFIYGFTVEQACKLIRSGGLINFFLQSKLTYYGDGSYKILKT